MTPSRVLSGPEIRALSGRSDLRGALRMGAHAAFIAAGVALVAVAGPWTLVPAMAVLGVGLATLFAPIHETMHLTAFRSRRANAVVGWLVASPSLLNWHFYTAFHLAHHRHTQDPALDPELTPPPPGDWDGYFARISGLNYWRARLAVVRDCWRGDLSAYPYVPMRAAAADHPQRAGDERGDAGAVGGVDGGDRLVGAAGLLDWAASAGPADAAALSAHRAYGLHAGR